jgi:hypothetical protein
MDSSKKFDPSCSYLLKNKKLGKYIQIYNDSWGGFGADGIRGTTEKIHGSIFNIVPLSKKYDGGDECVVAIESGSKYINRWHGGDSDGTELGMHGSLDDNS